MWVCLTRCLITKNRLRVTWGHEQDPCYFNMLSQVTWIHIKKVPVYITLDSESNMLSKGHIKHKKTYFSVINSLEVTRGQISVSKYLLVVNTTSSTANARNLTKYETSQLVAVGMCQACWQVIRICTGGDLTQWPVMLICHDDLSH